MPTRELLLCRGWRGLGAAAARDVIERDERDPLAPARLLVLVPTAAAAHLTRAQLERRLGARRAALVLPAIATPTELVRELTERSVPRLRLVDPLLREALVEHAFELATEAGAPPPFTVRSGLAARVIELYDGLLSRAEASPVRSLEAFVSRALEELDDPGDAGALKLAAQTRFLAATFGTYRAELSRLGLVDPPEARRALAETPFPYEEVLVLGSETLTPLDTELVTRAEGITSVKLFVAEGATAVPEHLQRAFETVRVAPEPREASPELLSPQEPSSFPFVARDREESLVDVARLLKLLEAEGRLPRLDRVAVVIPEPLPYLYLAKKVFREAGVPFQIQDSFPLAIEPALAAFDLALDLVESDAHRSAALALLRSPFYRFPGVGPAEVAALDELTLRFRVPGGLKRWRSLLERERRREFQPLLPGMDGGKTGAEPALAALVEAAEALAPLGIDAPVTERIDCLRRFLDRFARPLAEVVPEAELGRTRRARAALDSIVDRLRDAAEQIADPPVDLHRFRARLKRAIGTHTFEERTGRGGVQVVDARSAGFGAFDLVLVLGLNEGEWPRRVDRNIFFPQRILREFGWPSDREILARERVRFELLLELSSERVGLFRHRLEEEIPTVVSPFVEDAARWLAGTERDLASPSKALEEVVVTRSEALRSGRLTPPLPLAREQQNERRAGILAMPIPIFEPVSPTAFELYLRCPFKYLSRHLLGLEEEEAVDATLNPLERGRILHDLLKEAFADWDRDRDRPRPLDAESFDEALALFRRKALEKLPPDHRGIEMARLFGGPGDGGAIPWLLLREMDRGALMKRLVEHPFETPLRIERGPQGQAPWFVRLRGRVDRADLDASGQLHVFDYKSGRAPSARTALQVPLYAMCLSQELDAPVREAAYLSFRDKRATSRAEFQRAGERLAEAYGAVSEGRFPPRPEGAHLCASCGYAGVCRKEIDEGDKDAENELGEATS